MLEIKKSYSLPYNEVLNKLSVKTDYGLSENQVIQNREKFGENKLEVLSQKSKFVLLLEQFNDPVLYILMVAAILNAFLAELKDTFVIAAVVILNSVIGFIQESRASDAIKALRKMASPTARVIRNGIQENIRTEEIVVGDIIVLESGVRVPADGRLIETLNLYVDESMLTGESFAVEKKADKILPESISLGDRINIVYSGTIIQTGRGLAVVTAVGKNTEFGKISSKVAEAEETITPLQVQMEKFSKVLSIGIMSSVAVIFLIGYLTGNDWLTMFLTSVGLAVSAIPEGLPVAVTITLSIGISQMAKQNAIVKKLAAVETLGSCNVICTDKTGTLTKNQMTVTRIYCAGKEYRVTGSGYENSGEIIDLQTDKPVVYNYNVAIDRFSQISMFCTESTINLNQNQWEITGDPTESALMIFATKLKFEKPENIKITVDIPFESENQMMAVRAKYNDEDCVFAKGAPEQILAKCSTMLDDQGNKIPIDIEVLREIIDKFSENGLRVLALAGIQKNEIETITIDNLKDMTFVGFAGIEDAVRPEAVEAVKRCYGAGIKVIMITGDHSKTAQAVAKAVGIAPDKEIPVAITGQELDIMSDEDLFNKIDEIDVYARVAPTHKYRIVKQLQRKGNIVAMTGDGVNDAPALKQADIGVAMGTGTDVAKESAHMILMDDNFATIVKAVRRGRVVLHNLQHIILYILATSFGGILTIATSVFVGLPLPVLPAQLLWINLVTDGTSTFPLAFEKEHGNVMVFLPRKKDAPLISKPMFVRMIIASFIMMFGTLGIFYFNLPDMPLEQLKSLPHPILAEHLALPRTLAFCALAFFQIWNVQNSRSVERSLFFNIPYPGDEKIDRVSPFSNPILLAVMLLAVALQVSAVVLPFMNELLDTVPLDFEHWLLIAVSTFSIILIIEMIKLINGYYNFYKGKKRSDVNDQAFQPEQSDL